MNSRKGRVSRKVSRKVSRRVSRKVSLKNTKKDSRRRISSQRRVSKKTSIKRRVLKRRMKGGIGWPKLFTKSKTTDTIPRANDINDLDDPMKSFIQKDSRDLSIPTATDGKRKEVLKLLNLTDKDISEDEEERAKISPYDDE
jgi:hypothetical protein